MVRPYSDRLARFAFVKWDPGQHPRDPRTGRFTRKPQAPKPKVPKVPKVPDDVDLILPPARGRGRNRTLSTRLRRATDDQLMDLSARISGRESLSKEDEATLQAVWDELDRRDREATDRDGPADQATEAERRVDELVAQGWDYLEAYAEVNGKSLEHLREQETSEVTRGFRRKGEDSTRAVARMYHEHTYMVYLAAEEATRGHMLNAEGQKRGISPLSLFSGNATRARKYASEDLKRWWAENPRVTLVEYRAQLLKRPSDVRAVRRQASRGNGRDFGV